MSIMSKLFCRDDMLRWTSPIVPELAADIVDSGIVYLSKCSKKWKESAS